MDNREGAYHHHMSKLTNRFNADEAIAAWLTKNSYVGGGDISATGLSRAPQQRVLEKRHGHKVAEDISDRLPSARGQLAHAAVNESGIPNEWSEKRIGATVLGWTVTGQPDKFSALLLNKGTLIDFKFPTLSSFTFGFQRDKGLKPEYIQQGNIYRWLLWKNAVEVVKIVFKPTLLEWSRRHARLKKDYPASPFFNFTIPMWPLEQTEAWITERVRLHQEAEKLPDENLPECTWEERWGQTTFFAVKKDGRKNAVSGGIKDTKEAAEAMAKELGAGHCVEARPGEAVRCGADNYCRVRAFCHQLKRDLPEGVEA